MANRGSGEALGRVAREVARERDERALHDEERRGLGALDEEFRLKDARTRVDAGTLKRHPGR